MTFRVKISHEWNVSKLGAVLRVLWVFTTSQAPATMTFKTFCPNFCCSTISWTSSCWFLLSVLFKSRQSVGVIWKQPHHDQTNIFASLPEGGYCAGGPLNSMFVRCPSSVGFHVNSYLVRESAFVLVSFWVILTHNEPKDLSNMIVLRHWISDWSESCSQLTDCRSEGATLALRV